MILLPRRLVVRSIGLAAVLSVVTAHAATAQYYTVASVGAAGDPHEAALNDAGQVAGNFNPPGSSGQHPFLANPATHTFVDLGTLPGGSTAVARAINNAGQVVGIGNVGAFSHAFMYSTSSACPALPCLNDLGTLGGPHSSAYAINASGDVVGWADDGVYGAHAFLYHAGVMTDLNTLIPASISGWTLLEARAINDAGQIAGLAFREGSCACFEVVGFLYTPETAPGAGDATVVEIKDALSTGSFPVTEVTGINAAGRVIGTYLAPDLVNHQAFVFDPATSTVTTLSLGGAYSRPEAINGSGQVVGYSAPAPPFYRHAFLYSTTPTCPVACLVDLTPTAVFATSTAINAAGDLLIEVSPENANPTPQLSLYSTSTGTSVDLSAAAFSACSQWTPGSVGLLNNVGQITGEGFFTTGAWYGLFLLSPSPVRGTEIQQSTVSMSYGETVALGPRLMSGCDSVAGQTLALTINGVSIGSAVTDAGGFALFDNAISGLNTGYYPSAVVVQFAGAPSYPASETVVDLIIYPAPAPIVWPTPAPIAQGTPLGPTQLNATSPVPGAPTYTPPAGTILTGGTHLLQVAFQPADPANFSPSVSTVFLNVIPSNSAQPSYVIAAIPDLPNVDCDPDTQPKAMNAAGHAVGSSTVDCTNRHGFYYANGTTTDLGTAGADSSEATLISASDKVAGRLIFAGGSPHVFMHDGVSMHDLGSLGGSQAGPHAINDAGDVVGYSFASAGGVFAILSQGGGPVVDLTTLLSPADAAQWPRLESGLGINDATPFRQIAGIGFRYNSALAPIRRGFVATLSPAGDSILSISQIGPDSACFPDQSVNKSFAMNAAGQVTGPYFPGCAGPLHTFLYTPANGPQPATFVDATPSAQFSQPVTLNATGQVLLRADQLAYIYTPSSSGGTLNEIGTTGPGGAAGRALNDAGDAVGFSNEPFIFTGEAIRSLSEIMGPECQWTLADAVALNNAGQILGKGSLLSLTFGVPLASAFVLTPASVPPLDTFVNVEPAGALFGDFSAFLTAELRAYPRDPVYAQYFQDTFGFCPVGNQTLHFSIAGGPDIPRTTSAFGAATAEVIIAGMSAGFYPIDVQFLGDSSLHVNPSSGSGGLAISKVFPTLVWNTPAAIGKSTPLGNAQLNAVAYGGDGLPLQGTYDYSPPLGTLLPPGQHMLHVQFTPTDTVDYFYPAFEDVAILVSSLDVPCAPLVPCGLAMNGIPDLGGFQLEASVLNGLGDAAGWVTNADDEQDHAIRYSGGTTTDLGVPLGEFGDPESSFGYGLNDARTVVGAQGSCCEARATYWPVSGGVTELEPSSFDGYAEADYINAAGHAAGYGYLPDGSITSFLYDGTGGPLVFFGDLGGGQSYANGINRLSDVVVGDSLTADFVPHAYLYDGTTHDLGTLVPGDPEADSYTVGISDAGDVAGDSCVADCGHFFATYHAFVYDHTAGPGSPLIDLHTLGSPPTMGDPIANSRAVSISHSGAVVGAFERAPFDGGHDHAFLYMNGVVTDLGSLGGDFSTPCDFFGYYSDCVNASGQVIGYSTTDDGSFLPFVYANGAMHNVNTLLPPGSPWTILEVRAINDAGQILGVGCRSDLGEGFDFECPDGGVRQLFVSGPIGVAAFNGSPLAVATIVSPSAPSVEATNPAGAIAHLSGAGSTDPDAGDTLTFTWTGPFGTATGADIHVPLSFGTSTVTLTVGDGHGHITSTDVFPSVVDTTAPTLDFSGAPAAPVPATSPIGAVVTFVITASDLVDITDPVTCMPASGSTFPIGNTTVHCLSQDAHLNLATGTFVVSVTAVNSLPMCEAATPSLNVLWPADHRVVPISIAVPDADALDVVSVTVTGIYSDEPTNNEAIAATSVDGGYAGACSSLLGVGSCAPGVAYLRAERGTPKPPASNGRVYHIQFSATDGHSAACTGSVTVAAPPSLTVPAVDNLIQCNSTVANRVCAP